MRQFVVFGHEAPLTPDFSLDDLPGDAGHLDVLCRCVNSAFFLSHGIREDVRLHLVHRDQVAIRFEGRELRYLNPDERSTAARIRNALETFQQNLGREERKSSYGIYAAERSFEKVLEGVSEDSTVIWLHEEGEPVTETEPRRIRASFYRTTSSSATTRSRP
ncbi:MAG: tRNA (pseudouridine(54)-N(1))-methyltransferase [Methanonatronarchaeales archaeon]|nr:tRNA (pseudouridine(54)-N(1))-methyltransferase [Methanonatronarchaeales archaeon]